MKVGLNLATAPLVNYRRFLAGTGLAAALALVALYLLSAHAYRGWRANRELRGQISSLETEIRNSQRHQQKLADYFHDSKTREVMEHAAFLNSLIEQRSFPWTKIFMDLEQTLPAGVRVVSISPRMQNGRVEVKLIVGALSDEGKLKFLKALENSPAFSGIQVKQETHPNQAGSDHVMLELIAWYATT